MPIYKYYGYKAGLAALKSQRLGFRCPKNFNDPLELSFPTRDSNPRAEQLANALDVLRKEVVILSLTETPTDALMWARYGEDHKGFVVGYNTSDPFLNSPRYNLIPVDDGTVTYDAPSVSDIVAMHDQPTIQSLLHFGLGAPQSERQLDQLRTLAKRVFLTKHERWKKEKEVRVVKLLNSAFEEVSDYQADPLRRVVPFDPSFHRVVAPEVVCSLVPGLHLYEHQMKIEEVYLGARNPLTKQERNCNATSDRALADRAAKLGWVLRGVSTSPYSWELAAVDLDSDALVIAPPKMGLTYYSDFDADTARTVSRLASDEIDDEDRFEVSTWYGVSYLRKNEEFISQPTVRGQSGSYSNTERPLDN